MKTSSFLKIASAVLLLSFGFGCGQKEIATLKTERDGLQAKLVAMEKDRDKSASQIKWAESELAKASNGFQFALAGMSNTFQLERAGLLLTNGFLSGQVAQLKADLDAQHRRLLADQGRENEAKKTAPIKEGLKALRKLDSAANIGTSLSDYNRLLIDSQGPIREALDASDPDIKKFIVKADKAFQDAMTIWNFCNEFLARRTQLDLRIMEFSDNTYVFAEHNPEIAQLVLDYDIPGKRHSEAKAITIRRSIALTLIWETAKSNLQQAEKLFSAQTEKGAGSKAD